MAKRNYCADRSIVMERGKIKRSKASGIFSHARQLRRVEVRKIIEEGSGDDSIDWFILAARPQKPLGWGLIGFKISRKRGRSMDLPIPRENAAWGSCTLLER